MAQYYITLTEEHLHGLFVSRWCQVIVGF